MKIISVFIICIVACIVLATAVVIMRAAIDDPKNNIKLIYNSIDEHTDSVMAAAASSVYDPLISKPKTKQESPMASVGSVPGQFIFRDCVDHTSQEGNGGVSLSDFLSTRGLSPSFENRLRIAVEFGIQEYHGWPSQNRQLLALLQESERHFLAECSTISGFARGGSSSTVRALGTSINN